MTPKQQGEGIRIAGAGLGPKARVGRGHHF
jgi:hypothetical protein